MLGRTIARIGADIIHLRADVCSPLALRVAWLCGPPAKPAFVLEWAHPDHPDLSWPGSWLARRTLTRVDALVTRHAHAIAGMRTLGFHGVGVVASSGGHLGALSGRAAARQALGLPPAGAPVFGWAGRIHPKSDVFDLLEALAICQNEAALVIPVDGPLRNGILDHADALEILHRVRCIEPGTDGPARTRATHPVSGHPMLDAIDALILTPSRAEAARTSYGDAVEQAQLHGVPVIHSSLPGLVEMVGPGGWPVNAEDPGLLSCLLDEISANPALIAAASEAATAHAVRRHSITSVRASLALAVRAAYSSRRQANGAQDTGGARGFAHPGGTRKAGGT